MEKPPHGSAMFRNDRAEQRAAQSYERQQQRHLERLCEQIRADLEVEEGGEVWAEENLEF